MATLQITFGAHAGTTVGVDRDPWNPLHRALRDVLSTGRPFHRLAACYFNPHPLASGLRWFGVFNYSAGDRVIFFPGLAESQRVTQISRSAGAIQQRQFEVDHLSLEADRRDWHLTVVGSVDHFGRFRTTDLGEGRVLWFGMSIATPDVLRQVMATTEINSPIPESDARRRADIVMRAREGVEFNELLLNNSQPLAAPTFVHFNVVVGPCGFPEFNHDQLLALPFGSQYVAPPLPDPLTNVAMRVHRMRLPPHVDLEIITFTLPGAVSVPVTFTSP